MSFTRDSREELVSLLYHSADLQSWSDLRSFLKTLKYPWPSSHHPSMSRQLSYLRYSLDQWEKGEPKYLLRLLGRLRSPPRRRRSRWWSMNTETV